MTRVATAAVATLSLVAVIFFWAFPAQWRIRAVARD